MIPVFQRVPHFQGSNAGVDDLLLTPDEERALLTRPVYVMEKLDGLAVTIYRPSRRRIIWRLRPMWEGGLNGEVERLLHVYMQQRMSAWLRLLKPQMAAYGEWLGHTLSCHYDALPDLFFCYAMQGTDSVVLPLSETRARCQKQGISVTQPKWQGVLGEVEALQEHLGKSAYGKGEVEGVIVELVEQTKPALFGKWVVPSYQSTTTDALTGQRNELSPESFREAWP